ncbi:hypothetical protein [Streptomyces sp. Tu 6176]|nr:hypothetical protein [Streptomyces sp. Tu 6176]
MNEPTPNAPLRKPVRMCVRCNHIADEPVLVAEVHQNSGRVERVRVF